MTFRIEPYTPPQQRAVLHFIRTEWYIHQHLDWQPIWEWLKTDPDWVYLAMYEDKINGIVAFSEIYGDMTWLRLLALGQGVDNTLHQALFDYAVSHLQTSHVERIALLQMEAWLPPILLANDFNQADYLVHLERPANLPIEVEQTVEIRRATVQDLATIIHIDHSCFAPEWQMRPIDFTAVMEYASHVTIAFQNGQAIGYQLSTNYADGGVHLARLATLAEYRGQRVATQLLADLVHHFPGRRVTVNTQATNLSSLHLYDRLKFERRPMTTPFWVRYINLE